MKLDFHCLMRQKDDVLQKVCYSTLTIEAQQGCQHDFAWYENPLPTTYALELAPGPATYLLYIVAGPEFIGSLYWTRVPP